MKKRWYAAVLALTVMFVSACQTAPESTYDPADTQTAREQEHQEEQDSGQTVRKEAVEPLTDYVSGDEMALADQWPSCDDAALAKVMRKAAAGQPVTIACIGGSITQGTIAKGNLDDTVGFSRPYADIFREWWEKQFPDTEITFVNAGIGGTDSYLGVHRLKRDVLSQEPDLVLVEYAVNDANSFFYKRSYDNLLRNILQAESAPAVMLLFMEQTNGTSAQGNQVLVGFQYALPMISYANCIEHMMENGQYSASQLSGDGVHPSALGHAIAGELLWRYLNQVYEQRDELPEPQAFSITAATDDRYADADIADRTNVTPEELGTFSEQDTGEYFPDGWICEEGDGGLTVTLRFRNLGILYIATTDGKSGSFDILVDGESVRAVNADFSGGWGDAITATEVYTSEEEAEHTVTIKKTEGTEKELFWLLGFLTS